MQLSPNSIDDEERISSEREIFVGEPMEVDRPTPPSHLQQHDEDEFWLGTSITGSSSAIADAPGAETPAQDPENIEEAPVFHLEIAPVDQDVSSLASDIHLLEWRTESSEVEYFEEIFNILDRSFEEWEIRIDYPNLAGRKPDIYSDEATLNLPSHLDCPVFFGISPDGGKFWEGYVRLHGNYTGLVKLDISTAENNLFGVKFGGIYNFDTTGPAELFMGIDRNVYYTDGDGDVSEDDEELYRYHVHGPYNLRKMRCRATMDPFPSRKLGQSDVDNTVILIDW